MFNLVINKEGLHQFICSASYILRLNLVLVRSIIEKHSLEHASLHALDSPRCLCKLIFTMKFVSTCITLMMAVVTAETCHR